MRDDDFLQIDIDVERVFERKSGVEGKAVVWLIGGVLLLMFAVMGFVLALRVDVGELRRHSMTTVPFVCSVGALIRYFMVLRSPFRVTISDDSLEVTDGRGDHHHAWSTLAWASAETALFGQKVLVIHDRSGKSVATIGNAIEEFDEMCTLIHKRLEPAAADQHTRNLKRTKLRRQGIWIALASVLFFALGVANGWFAYSEQRAAELLDRDGVEGVARIVDRRLAPNGVTPRLEYEVADETGITATRNAQVERYYWDGLEGQETVPVIYVPGEPSISRLVTGEHLDDDITKRPAVMYGLAGVVMLVSLAGVGIGIAACYGWDAEKDPETGKLRIQRLR